MNETAVKTYPNQIIIPTNLKLSGLADSWEWVDGSDGIFVNWGPTEPDDGANFVFADGQGIWGDADETLFSFQSICKYNLEP